MAPRAMAGERGRFLKKAAQKLLLLPGVAFENSIAPLE